jgi:hypothetical protein
LDNFPRDRLEDSKILHEIKNNVENAADKLYYISNASNAMEISVEKNKKRDEERERVWAEDHAKQVQLRQRGGEGTAQRRNVSQRRWLIAMRQEKPGCSAGL